MKFVFLTKEFYDDYENGYDEIEKKSTLPYVQVCIEIDNHIFAIPLRSHITHKYALLTDKQNQCGLDFSKAVLITDYERYIDKFTKPHIRQNEFEFLRGKEYETKKRLTAYIKRYFKAKKKLHIEEYKKLCECSTLQYFEEHLQASFEEQYFGVYLVFIYTSKHQFLLNDTK